MRQLAAKLLRKAGYTVLVAANGRAALALAEQHTGPVHLLLTDVVMPGMSGPELAVQFTERRPGARVLYMSGYPGDAAAQRGALAPGIAFLQKPFLPETLVRRIREVLDQR